MFNNKSVAVIMPAYNAEKTLKLTFEEIPHNIVDFVILVDDKSSDKTYQIAKEIGVKYVIRHEENFGYGGNQKTCFKKALELNADIVVMLHPDYQYTPKLIEAMVSLIGNELYPVVFASRILGKGAIKGGMPVYKYLANRVLTALQNLFMGQKLSEYHTGYRAYSKKVLLSINFLKCSNNFIFDNEIIAQLFKKGFQIGEISCPTKYFEDSSSISFKNSVIYGFGVLNVSLRYFLDRLGIFSWALIK